MSRAASRVRAAAADSRVIRVLAATTDAIRTPRPWPTSHTVAAESEVEALRNLLAETRAGRALVTPLAVTARAWSGAATRRVIERLMAPVARLTRSQRIRAVGVWLFVAALVAGVAAPLDPRPVSAYRWMLWATAVALGSVMTTQAEQVAMAWTEWRRRSLKSEV